MVRRPALLLLGAGLASALALLLLLLPLASHAFVLPSPAAAPGAPAGAAAGAAAARSSRPAQRLYAEPPKKAGEEKEKEPAQKQWWQPESRWREEDGLYVDGLEVSELPDSFDDALQVAVDCARQAFESGRERVRIDFDTTAGDLTYTTLKNSLPLALAFAQYLGQSVLDESKIEVDEEGKKVGYSGPRLVVIFPDTGSAVWSEQEWKAGKFTKSALVPPSVRCAAFPNEFVDEQDAAFLIVCPRASESQAVFDLLTGLGPGKRVVLMNPELINAEVVGFGMAGRRIRDEVENKFERAYYLKTLSWGALTRRWPAGYSVWLEDERVEEGYRLLKTVGRFPSLDELEDIRDAALAQEGGDGNRGLLSELGRFIDSFKRM